MSQRICPQCSSSSIEIHEGRGETICTNCGTVLEENTMVEGLQFSECSNGSMQMVGHFVPSSGVRGFALVYGNRESREHVLQRGYHNLQRIADQLRLSSSHIESAQRVFLMAVQRSFTIGRNNMHVASACLYAICRREKTPHMLIDFSDVLQTPVKVLGQVFMKLLRLLRLHVPNIDPSMFMERFAAQMKLGDKTHSVAATGVRIVQALTRNWITTGRRPTGLCGAALLISARYHGIPVSSSEIAQIVRISSPTLLKRLAEFRHTSTAQLTADEFENTDLLSLPIVRGPPCFERNRLKDENNKLSAITNAPENLAIENLDSKSKTTEVSTDNESEIHIEENDDFDIQENEQSNKNLSFPKFLGGIELDINQDKLCNDEPTSQDITVIASKLINAFDKANTNSEISNNYDENQSSDNLSIDPLKILFKDFNETDNLNENNYDKNDYSKFSNNNEIDNFINSNLTNNSKYQEQDTISSSDDLSEISDSEINDLLLDEDEKEAKKLLWDEITKDTLPPSWLRKINKETTNEFNNEKSILEFSENLDSNSTRKRKGEQDKEPSKSQKIQPENAIESVLMALQKTSPGATKHVNSDTLAKLFTVISLLKTVKLDLFKNNMNEIKFYNSNLGCMKVSFKDNYEESDDNTHNYIESITYNFKKSYFISENNKLTPIFEEFCKTAIKFSSLYPMVLGENVVCKILMNDIINNSNYSLEFWKKESHNAVTVEEFLLSQINIHTIEGLRRNPNNGVVKFLWTVRAINFIYNLIENVILRSEENLYTSILDAYNHSLKPYHGFVKFGIAMMAFKLAPKKSQLISSLGFPNTEFGLNHLRKFMSVAKPCIIEINSLIDKHGCNFPDKV